MNLHRTDSGLIVVGWEKPTEEVRPDKPVAVCCKCGKESWERLFVMGYVNKDGFCYTRWTCGDKCGVSVMCKDCRERIFASDAGCPVCGNKWEYT